MKGCSRGKFIERLQSDQVQNAAQTEYSSELHAVAGKQPTQGCEFCCEEVCADCAFIQACNTVQGEQVAGESTFSDGTSPGDRAEGEATTAPEEPTQIAEVHTDTAGQVSQEAEQGVPGVQDCKELIFEVDEEALRHRPQCGPQNKQPRAVLTVGGRRSSQRLSAEAKHIRSGDRRSSAHDTSGMLTAWMTVLLMIGVSSALEYLNYHELASAIRSQLVVPSAAATMATLQWFIQDINHLQTMTVSIEAAVVVLGLQEDCGNWAVWTAELAITAWLVMKATSTWRKQTGVSNVVGQRHDRNNRTVSHRSSNHGRQHGVLDGSSRVAVLDVKAGVAVFSSMVVLAVEPRGVCIRSVSQVQGNDGEVQMFRRQGERLPTKCSDGMVDCDTPSI